MSAVSVSRPTIGNRTVIFLLIVAGAILVKALVLFVVLPAYQARFPSDYQADLFPDGYDFIAENLVAGHGYRLYTDTSETMIRTPGFVLVLAGLFWVFGKSLAVVKEFHLVISTVTALLVYRLGRRITGSAAAAALAALFYFFFPGTVISDSRGGVETLFAFTIALFLLLLYRAREENSFAAYAAAGAGFGAMMLVRSSPGLFPALLAVHLVVTCGNVTEVKSILARLVMFGAAASLVMSPWIIRNAALTGRFIPTMSVGSLAAFEGLYIAEHAESGKPLYELIKDAVGKQMDAAHEIGLQYKEGAELFPQFYSASDELRYYDHLSALVVREYRNNPSALLQLMKFNALAFWVQGRTVKSTLFNALLSLPFLLLALLGLSLCLQRNRPVGLLVLFIAAFYVAHLPIMAVARFYIPLVPLLSIPAALAILWLGARLRQTVLAVKALAARSAI